MSISIVATEIPDVLELISPIFTDERGFFTEIYNRDVCKEAGFSTEFVQDNASCSTAGTLRGLHYQIEPHGQGKLVRVLSGRIFDVAVDIRYGSPTFGKWVSRTLTAENGKALWIPVGFAHGFQATENDTIVVYKCTRTYEPNAERSIRYDDPSIGITWPETKARVSQKDAAAPLLDDAEFNFRYSPD